MSDNEVREFERRGKAAIVAGAAALILGFVGMWASYKGSLDAVGWAIAGGFGIAAVGALAGNVGADMTSLNRAGFAGAATLGTMPASIAIPFALADPTECRYFLWPIVAACALGSICGQLGWLLGGRASNDPNRPKPGQFTIRQFLAFFIPVAIYFGFVRYLLQR